MFGEFLGHGIFAMQQKTKFVEMLTAMTMIQQPLAGTLMFWIGVVDVIVATIILFKPYRILLIWGTSGQRNSDRAPVSNPIWDFVERFANIVPPAFISAACPRTKKNGLINTNILKLIA
jgi:hypothetical protein